MSTENITTVVKRSSVLRSLKTVAWSFIGIRSSAGFQEDVAKVNALHVLLAGVITVLVLVVSLIGLATWVVGK
jgi:Protein of unknown function (DUF2970)